MVIVFLLMNFTFTNCLVAVITIRKYRAGYLQTVMALIISKENIISSKVGFFILYGLMPHTKIKNCGTW